MLQQDSGDAITSLLLQMSAQIANNALPKATIPTFSKPASAIRINIFWFTSLVFSLTAALVGLLVKQWLHHSLGNTGHSPREMARVRQFRRQGLDRWHVLDIVAFLPVLLQLSLICFFIGLLDLLWVLDGLTAGIVSAFVVMSLLFLVVTTTLLPAIHKDFPHQSPQAFALLLFEQWATKPSGSITLHFSKFLGWTETLLPLNTQAMGGIGRTRQRLVVWAKDVASREFPQSWGEREKLFIRRNPDQLDHQIITSGEDDVFLELVRGCVNDVPITLALDCVLAILTKRSHDVPPDGIPSWRSFEVVDKASSALVHLVTSTLWRVVAQDDTNKILKVLYAFRNLCRALPFEHDHPDVVNLHQQTCSALIRFLHPQCEIENTVQDVAFSIAYEVSGRSNAPIRATGKSHLRSVSTSVDVACPIDIEAIVHHAALARSAKNYSTFGRASFMALKCATTELPEVTYEELRDHLERLVGELEVYLEEVRETYNFDAEVPAPSLLNFLLDSVRKDPELVDRTILQNLATVTRWTPYGSPGSDAMKEAEQATKRATHYLGLPTIDSLKFVEMERYQMPLQDDSCPTPAVTEEPQLSVKPRPPPRKRRVKSPESKTRRYKH